MKIIPEKTNHKPAFAYFITIRTYATWLHGDARGSVDPQHKIVGNPLRKYSHSLHYSMQLMANETPFLLEEENMQKTVLESMMHTCNYLKWTLFAIHVRTNHVHLVLQSEASKEKTMGALKRYATKALKKYHPGLCTRNKFWARHGSTKNIWAPEKLFPALYYVIKEQGKPLALYYDKRFYDPADEILYECYFDRN
jgi:REP element-mobilizing transposase RayT